MNKLILTLYPKPAKTAIETVALLEAGEKISIPAIRKALHKLDLENKLIFSTNSSISKLFKQDYSFNDHGCYYDLQYHSQWSSEVDYLEVEKVKLIAKLDKAIVANKDTTQIEIDLKAVEFALEAMYSSNPNSIVVFAESSTMVRDWERFNTYDTFVDPVEKITVFNNLLTNWANYSEFILDIETTGLSIDNDVVTMIGIKPIGLDEAIIEEMPSKIRIDFILHWLSGKTIIAHNALFDMSFLMKQVALEFMPDCTLIDTMLLAHVAGEEPLSLKHLSMMYGNFKGRRNTMNADADYLVEDLLTTECLYNKFKPFYNTFAGRLSCEAVKAFVEVKLAGCPISEDYLFKIRDEYKSYDQPKYDFNVNSNRELAKYFIDNGVKLVEKTNNGDYSVDQRTLERINHPTVKEYQEYQKELTIYQKYIIPYTQMDSYLLRPDILLHGTKTGRLSCKNPNIQQIPNSSKFKDIFRSRFEGGYIATIDLDRAELGIAALLSGDEVYVKALTSQDFHKLVASKTFQKPEDKVTKLERFTAKSVNFGGVLYGGSAKGIATRIDVDPSIVQAIQDWYKVEFVTLTNWIESTKQSSVNSNVVITYFGRVRNLEGLRYDQKQRIGVNTAVQSVASDVMLYIVTRLATLLRNAKAKSKIMFPVHDELLLDLHPEEVDLVADMLKQAFKDVLKTPLGKLPLSSTLAISGTLEYADSWLYLKSDKYEPKGRIYISSLGE